MPKSRRKGKRRTPRRGKHGGAWSAAAIVLTLGVFAALTTGVVWAAVSHAEPEEVVVAQPASEAVRAASPSTGHWPAGSTPSLVDEGWASATSSRTGIPLRALVAYAGAELAMSTEAPGCGIRWTTLAALGRIESSHGTHGGSSLTAAGVARPGIFGPDLDGRGNAHIADTDGGALDGTSSVDRAVGPMQFIPATWKRWGADGSGDGVADPQQIDDAALTAARYLSHYGDLTRPASWRQAIFAYNHLDSYVLAIAREASRYAAQAAA